MKNEIFWSEIGSGFGELGGNSMVHNYYNIYFLTKKTTTKQAVLRDCVTCYVISMVYTLMIGLDQSAREDSLSYCKKHLVIYKAIIYDCNTDLT